MKVKQKLSYGLMSFIWGKMSLDVEFEGTQKEYEDFVKKQPQLIKEMKK